MAEQEQTLTIQQAIDLAVQHHNEGRLSQAMEDIDALLDPLKPDPALCVARSQLALFSGDRVRPYDLLDQAANRTPENLFRAAFR